MRGACLMLALSGCFAAQPHEVKTADLAAQLNSGELRPKKLTVASGGRRVSIRPGTPLRFCRPDGTRTPWVNAGEVWISDGGLFIWRKLPLGSATRVKMEQLDGVAAALLPQAAPSEVQLIWSGKDSVEAAAPADWLAAFVLAVARQEWVSHRGLSERWFNHRAMKQLRDMHGAPLGRWSFLTPRGWTEAIAGDALLEAIASGLSFADGLRWDDVRCVEVWNEAESAGNVALTVLADLLIVGAIGAAAVIVPPVAAALGRGAPLPQGVKLAAHALTPGEPEQPAILSSTGEMLWRPPLRLPDTAGARALVK